MLWNLDISMDVSEMGQTWFEIIMKWNGYRMDIDGERYSSLRDEIFSSDILWS